MRASVTDFSSSDRWRPLRCSVRPHRDELWVAPDGELDMESSGLVRAVLDEYMGAGFRRLVLDLRELTFIDSTGLHTVMAAREAAAAAGVDFAIAPGPPQVQRIFAVTGTTELFQVVQPH